VLLVEVGVGVSVLVDVLVGVLVEVGVLVAVAVGVGVMDYGWTEWKPLVFAALAAAAVVIINVLNPKDSRYGLGAGSSE